MTNGLEFQEYPQNMPYDQGEVPLYIGIHSNGKGVAPHYHSFAELTFVVSGSGFKTVNGKAHRMKPGATCLYLPNHIHGSRPDPEGPTARVICCMFDSRLIADASLDSASLKLLYQVGSALPSFVYLEEDRYRQMEKVLGELLDEYARPAHTIGRTAMIRNKLSEALILFLRSMAIPDMSSEQAVSAKTADDTFWQTLQYVHVHYMDNLTLDLVAQRLRLSASYITRMFKEHTGAGFLPYVHRLRVNSAAQMLITTDLPVADITFAAGFESFRTFARVFREMKGLTPTQYRNLHQQLCP
ncbi:MAG: AraC family transcriptional regulator [Paenibacillus sp.]|nr:AraC family transcriptional regulator [Paenibacillus sp.]